MNSNPKKRSGKSLFKFLGYTGVYWGISFFVFGILSSCKKLTHIGEPVNTITTSETFNSDANAISAVIAIYNHMTSQQEIIGGYANSATTIFGGLSADELRYFLDDPNMAQLQSNNILVDNSYTLNYIWKIAYFNIYQANASIEGLNASSNISSTTKDQLIGEAKFLRAFSYFYLINFFGDVPLLSSSAWSANQLQSRSSVLNIYQQIIADLKDAQNLLPVDYSNNGNLRIRANTWAATALLARVYLYTNDWNNAEIESSKVIGNGSLFSLEALNKVFTVNSREAILQLQVRNYEFPYATKEGNILSPTASNSNPTFYLTQELIQAFDTADKRKAWIDSTVYSNKTYYYPKKYRVRVGTMASTTENYVILRLSEQYLIRAEANAQKNKLSEAVADLNVIRQRAGISPLSISLNQAQVLSAIEQENRIEFFAEWGHRWFDLKRWGRADAVLRSSKGSSWKTAAQLYPIPLSEMVTDPNLNQNPDY